jgi:hypothetical protein
MSPAYKFIVLLLALSLPSFAYDDGFQTRGKCAHLTTLPIALTMSVIF